MAADRKTLVQTALKSPGLKSAAYLRKLLQYLDSHAGETISADDIWEEVLGETEAETDGQRVRELVSRLRKALDDATVASQSQDYLGIPDADEPETDDGAGYRLVVRQKKGASETEGFWRVHTKSDNVKLVYVEPVFYFDLKNSAFLRFLDTNPRTVDSIPAHAELESKHSAEINRWYGDSARSQLRPTRAYIGIGEMEAMEWLSFWFRKRAQLTVARVVSDRFPSLHGGCPILLGSERTNRFIEYCLESEEGRKFCYRQREAPVNFVEIRNASDDEKQRLSGFTILSDGAVTVVGQSGTSAQLRDRLVVVTRMPLPGGKGATTMISSDSTLAIREAVATVTDDDRLRDLMTETGLDPAEPPANFEMLLSVRIAPANIEYESSIPRLIGCRKY